MPETADRLIYSLPVRVLLKVGLGSAIPSLRRARRSFQRPALDSTGNIPTWRYQRWLRRAGGVSPLLPVGTPVEETGGIFLSLTGLSDWVTIIFPGHEMAESADNEIAHAIADHPDAEVFYFDEDKIDESGQRVHPRFKPAWSPDYLRSHPYVGGLFVLRRDLLQRIGAFSTDYDLALKAGEL